MVTQLDHFKFLAERIVEAAQMQELEMSALRARIAELEGENERLHSELRVAETAYRYATGFD